LVIRRHSDGRKKKKQLAAMIAKRSRGLTAKDLKSGSLRIINSAIDRAPKFKSLGIKELIIGLFMKNVVKIRVFRRNTRPKTSSHRSS